MTEDQVSSGEFADLRPNPKVYLDSNIVSAIAKDDIPTESEALNRLLQAWDGEIEQTARRGEVPKPSSRS
jgi:hypothetical protein